VRGLWAVAPAGAHALSAPRKAWVEADTSADALSAKAVGIAPFGKSLSNTASTYIEKKKKVKNVVDEERERGGRQAKTQRDTSNQSEAVEREKWIGEGMQII